MAPGADALSRNTMILIAAAAALCLICLGALAFFLQSQSAGDEAEPLGEMIIRSDVTGERPADAMRARDLQELTYEPAFTDLRMTDAAICGSLYSPQSFLPRKGGDIVSFPQPRDAFIYDSGDIEDGPDLYTHDRLVLPGRPEDLSVSVAGHSVFLCFEPYSQVILLYRQRCEGHNWNNAFEAIVFQEGAVYVHPRLMEEIDTGVGYMNDRNWTALKKARPRVDKTLPWETRPFPAALLPSAEAQDACEADLQRRRTVVRWQE